jgi:hypothetical protein
MKEDLGHGANAMDWRLYMCDHLPATLECAEDMASWRIGRERPGG